MKKILFVPVLVFIISCANDKKEKKAPEPARVQVDSTLVTDSSWGAITRTTDFEGLKNIFGSANVKDEEICGPECIDSIDVTVIYPGATNEIVVYWTDSGYHKTISMLQTSMPDAPYRTTSGLKIGSTMHDLLKVNGQKISFSGFGWDYGGYIQSYNNGALENSPVYFRLDLTEGNDNNLLGDVELNTDMPAVKSVLGKIEIYQLGLSFVK